MTPVAAPRPVSTRRGVRVPDPAPAKQIRCGIYTRKSTNEGLDSDFTTLDVQRQAAESYIASQGWTVLPDRYDDGGFSGSNLERPALKRLLADIDAGRVDCVVVHKIDRLSRSLLDFVRIAEVFEARNVGLVSVTQQISTTTSAGRLMLNVLFSFAQFEREIIGERTSAAMSAARKKGRYIGGCPPLGFDVDRVNHRLVVNPEEANVVLALYDLYIEHRSLLAVVKEVNTRGWTKKSWQNGKGLYRTGHPFDKVYLQRLLTNPLYIGQVTLHGEVYPGLQDAIIDEETFRQVGDLLTANRNGGDVVVRNRHGALLRGLLRCGRCGASMAHTWTRKGSRIYSYYGCNTAQKQGRSACPTPTLSAGDIEATVVNEIRRLAQDPALIDQVFAETLNQTGEKRQRLESERTRLLRQRQQREEAIQRLVSTLEHRGGELPEVVAERIGERQAEVAQINGRLATVEADLASLRGRTIDREHLMQTLAQFTDLWDVLYPRERIKLVHSVIETIHYHDATSRVEIRFRISGNTQGTTVIGTSVESE